MTSTLAAGTSEAISPNTPTSAVAATGNDSRAVARDSWLALSGLVVLGGISGAAYYLGFVKPYRLDQYYKTPLLDLAKINGHTAQSANWWALTWIVLFACYYLAFRICPPSAASSRTFRRVALAIICGWAAFFAINLVFMYPVGAADLFDQIFRARLLGHYQLNPFTTLPRAISDPFQPYVAWSGDPSPYGPVWELLAAGVSLLAGDSLWNNLVLFKLLVMVAYGIGVALTYGILRVVRPDWALRGTLFFAWNPLVVFEVAGNGHNDAIVAVFILGGVYLLVRAWRAASIVSLTAAALAKFVPILLLPVTASAIWHDRMQVCKGKRGDTPISSRRAFVTLVVGGVLALLLAVGLYAPFWNGTRTIGPLGRQNLFTASIPKVVLDILTNEGQMPAASAEQLVSRVAFGLAGVVAVGLAVWVFLRRNSEDEASRQQLLAETLVSYYEIIFFFLAFATLWFQPWYLIWLVALTAPTGSLVRAHRTILFCLGGVANYFIWDYIWLWNRTDIRTLQISSAMAVYIAPLLYTLYTWVLGRTRREPLEQGEVRLGTATAGED